MIIMNYRNEINKAKHLLDDSDFNLCAMQCGRIIEAILKVVLNELTHAKHYVLKPNIKRLLSKNLNNSKKLTLGGLVRLIKASNAFKTVCEYDALENEILHSIDFDTIVNIRNRASHEDQDDLEDEAGADAYIIYGYLLKLMHLVNSLSCFKTSPQVDPKKTSQTTQIGSRITPSIVDVKKSNAYGKKTTDEGIEDIGVCRNRKSQKLFIFLRKISSDKALFILPDGKEKTLALNLFHKKEEDNKESLASKHLITKEQIEKLSVRSEKKFNRKRRIIVRPKLNREPKYISKYRNMLNNPGSLPSRMLDVIKQRRRISWKDVRHLLKDKYGYSESGSFGASLRVLEIDKHIEIIGRGEQKTLSIR